MKQLFAICDKCEARKEIDMDEIYQADGTEDINLPSGWRAVDIDGEVLDLCPADYKEYQSFIKRFTRK